MQSGSWFLLVNPAIALTLSAAFLALRIALSQHRYLGAMSLAYLLYSIGFLTIQLFPGLFHVGANAVFVAGMLCLCAGLTGRYGMSPRWSLLAPVGLAIVISGLVFSFTKPGRGHELLFVNVMFGAMFLITAWDVRHAAWRRLADKVVLVCMVFAGLQYLPRTLLTTVGAPDGGPAFLESTYWIVTNFSGAVIALALAVSVIVAAVADLVEGTAEPSVDRSTGLHTRRSFERAMKAAESAMEPGVSHSLILVDVDRVKSINERFGHVVGDAVIANFSALLHSRTPNGAVAARLAGVEFAMLLANCNIDTAAGHAETIRQQFALTRHDILVGRSATASFGVAEWRQGQTAAATMARASKALTLAKAAGRNRVSVLRHGEAGDLLANDDAPQVTTAALRRA